MTMHVRAAVIVQPGVEVRRQVVHVDASWSSGSHHTRVHLLLGVGIRQAVRLVDELGGVQRAVGAVEALHTMARAAAALAFAAAPAHTVAGRLALTARPLPAHETSTLAAVAPAHHAPRTPRWDLTEEVLASGLLRPHPVMRARHSPPVEVAVVCAASQLRNHLGGCGHAFGSGRTAEAHVQTDTLTLAATRARHEVGARHVVHLSPRILRSVSPQRRPFLRASGSSPAQLPPAPSATRQRAPPARGWGTSTGKCARPGRRGSPARTEGVCGGTSLYFPAIFPRRTETETL
jgi:hypothetical protein